MPEYDQLRDAVRRLESLRNDLVAKIERGEGDERILTDLHQRVSKALKSLSGQG